MTPPTHNTAPRPTGLFLFADPAQETPLPALMQERADAEAWATNVASLETRIRPALRPEEWASEMQAGQLGLCLLHYAGHGQAGSLMFTPGERSVAFPGIEGMVRQFDGLRDLRLIFLNACNTLPLAKAIAARRHCAVVCTNSPVYDTQAAAFARAFYAALLAGATIEEAFSQACIATEGNFPRATEHRGLSWDPNWDSTPTYALLGEADARNWKLTHLTNLSPTDYLTPGPERPQTFIGRRDEIRAVYGHLQSGGAAALVTGTGGMGKTAIAREYWHRYASRYSHALWLSAAQGLESSILQHPGLQDRTGLKDAIEALRKERMPEPEMLAWFLGKLSDSLAPPADQRSPALMVLDNLPEACDPRSLQALRDLRSNGWHVLLTSRQGDIPRISPVQVGVLPAHEARALFYAHYRHGTDDEIVDAILHAIGGHTLLIELLAQMAHKAGWTLAELHKRLEEKGWTVSRQYDVSSEYAPLPIADIEAFIIGIFDMSALPPAEQEILRHCALLPSDPTPAELLTRLLPSVDPDSDWLPAAQSRLADRNWLTGLGDRTAYGMHPVVQQALRKAHPLPIDDCRPMLHALIDSLGGDRTADPRSYLPAIAAARAVLTHFPTDDADLATLCNNTGVCLGNTGGLAQALTYKERALRIHEAIWPPQHPELAGSYNNVGISYEAAGDIAKGLEYQERALRIYEAILPPDHPDLAGSYNNVGCSYEATGNIAKGLAYKERALRIYEVILPPQHPNLAMSYNNVGNSYHAAGDIAKGLEYRERALRIREPILPPQHPDLAASYNNVGISYEATGNIAKGLAYQERALRIREAILPPLHPDLARSYNNVGASYETAGDIIKGLTYKERALRIREAILPPQHSDLAASYNNVGSSYSTAGDIAKGLAYFERALRIHEAILPPDHPDLAASYNNVGVSYHATGDLAKGLEYKERALRIREAILPPQHPDLAQSYNNVGLGYYKLGQREVAAQYWQRAFAIVAAAYPESHPLYRTIVGNLAKVGAQRSRRWWQFWK